MQKHLSHRNDKTGIAAFPRKSSPLLQLAATCSHRKVRIVLPPMPPRQLCLSDRKLRAAARAMELAFWQISGGDFLLSSLAAEVRGLFQAVRP